MMMRIRMTMIKMTMMVMAVVVVLLVMVMVMVMMMVVVVVMVVIVLPVARSGTIEVCPPVAEALWRCPSSRLATTCFFGSNESSIHTRGSPKRL